jgi:hypothetical protein
VNTSTQPTVGAAGFLAALAANGYPAVERNGIAVFDYTIEVGTLAGQKIRIGLQIPPDWPLTPPPGPHVNPRLGHPGGAVSGSPLGSDWEYWSRPADLWPADRSMRAYLRHLRKLFSQR